MNLTEPAARSASILIFLVFLASACDSGTPGPPEAVPVPGGDEEQTSTALAEGTDEAPVPDGEAAEAAPQVPDYQIVTRIRTRYLADEHVRPFTPVIRVSSQDGVVTLAGAVELAIVSVRAEAIARGTYGVASVENQIEAPAATEEEAAGGAEVPVEVMAIEPEFADAVRNYETNGVISEIPVVRRPDPTERAEETPPADGADEPPVGPPSEQGEDIEEAAVVPTATPTDPEPEQVNTDSPDEAQEDPPPDVARRTYTVQSGDTLWTIAESQLGSGARWEELLEANNDRLRGDPDRLWAGMEIVIPE